MITFSEVQAGERKLVQRLEQGLQLGAPQQRPDCLSARSLEHARSPVVGSGDSGAHQRCPVGRVDVLPYRTENSLIAIAKRAQRTKVSRVTSSQFSNTAIWSRTKKPTVAPSSR